ncbi:MULTISPECIES: prolipoprotein diacylglyceryl transferase [Sphingobacterium]|uniref:prolipoprotein diacylglyceryl transferase n=1 Tax=Sphingobacterium TaxID=28453 RepID=UPI0013DB1E88|nr:MULTISPECIES: prolipoprotein diacylglyceryl transferase [unclassified Sphingobacterium]
MDFIFNAIHWNIDQELFKIGSFGIRYYSLCWLLAFAVSYILMLKVYKREGRTQEDLDKLSIYIFLGTLIGARVGHCLFYEFDVYITKPWMIFLPFQVDATGEWHFTGFQGLASHGAAVGILTALYLYARKTKTGFVWIADRLVLVVPLAGAFVRLGNFFNSEIVGKPADSSLPWAVIFENAGLTPAELNMLPRHPAQLYEAIGYVILFFILWSMYQKNKDPKPGLLFGIFLVILFGIRFFVEFYKENQEEFEAGMLFNMGQLLSIPFIIAGIYLIFRKQKSNTVK